MIALILIAATVIGAFIVFGNSLFVLGFALMACGLLGLMVFLATTASAHKQPGETGAIVEERHYIGDPYDRHHVR